MPIAEAAKAWRSACPSSSMTIDVQRVTIERSEDVLLEVRIRLRRRKPLAQRCWMAAALDMNVKHRASDHWGTAARAIASARAAAGAEE